MAYTRLCAVPEHHKKKLIIPFLDKLTFVAEKTQSVNTIFKKDNKIFGDNTDVDGFEYSLKNINYNVGNKKIFILGAGGVVSSIISSLCMPISTCL